MLACAADDGVRGEILNVGVDHPSTFLELAETLVRVAGSGRWEFAPFTAERKAQEPGDFYSDIAKIRAATGWSPTTTLERGLERTVAYYRKHRAHYWTPDATAAPPAERRLAG